MERECYDVQEGHGITVVKLTQNFRSHATILKFPNDHFYAGDLVPVADGAKINAYLGLPLLPQASRDTFPLVFHAVIGKDERESTSPSFFNVDEILQIKSYVKNLKENRAVRTTDHDIGIISPYHAQCLKLRSALRPFAENVKVASVEEFQGQERKVILVSTVRSSTEFVDYDLRHTLGFVANPRRFNVTVTRAQALLVIVGNPHVLGLDPLWRSFLNYVHLNGGWVGPDIPWDPTVHVDLTIPIASTPAKDSAGPSADSSDAPRPRYDVAARKQAELDMDAFTKMVEALTLSSKKTSSKNSKGGSPIPTGSDTLEADANIERPWTRVDAE